ncbi:MAG: excisionase [Clostridiales bacterium]|nr:excisionase [Clostridiales bacterium]
MRNYKYKIPIYAKYGLTIEEAAEFSCIGAGKLREIIAENSTLDFILHKGSQVIIKRPQFEQWLENVNYI